MATLSKLAVGQTLYSLERQRMGNTTVSRTACYPVKIVAIDPAGEWVEASWNGNKPRRFYEASVRKWRVNKPEPKRTIGGMPDYA